MTSVQEAAGVLFFFAFDSLFFLCVSGSSIQLDRVAEHKVVSGGVQTLGCEGVWLGAELGGWNVDL